MAVVAISETISQSQVSGAGDRSLKKVMRVCSFAAKAAEAPTKVNSADRSAADPLRP